ncbi:MAG TPA: cytochrome c maturation protein CcmE [Chitinophagaceae bacterium]|jgi:cytochrome c-type biogenesis protein CcmE|nr:cytochrome c maturation protein CcmE [Chitinophagaceae bacterium]
MKKTHIVILVLIAAAIAVLVSYTGNLTTYETVASARQKEGKFVRLIAKVDKSQPVEYDAAKDPNYMSFTAIDTLGNTTKVIFHNSKPPDFEKSERLVLNGKMQNGQFECKDMLMKCPSKYKDDPNVMKKNLTITN